MPKFRRKLSDDIEAIRWTGENLAEIQAFVWPLSPLVPPASPTTARRPLGLPQPGGSLEWVEIDQWVVRIADRVRAYDDVRLQEEYEPVEDAAPRSAKAEGIG